MAEKNILVVDDEEQPRSMMEKILSSKNGDWQVDVAFSEAEAKDKTDNKHYHVIVTDMKMENDESGLAVLKYAKEKNESTEVIVITAYPRIKNADYAMGLKAFGYVSKLDDDAYLLMCEKVEKALSGQHDFDVFLCHNSEDKKNIKAIGKILKKNEIWPWLDEWELRPGVDWIDVLEEQIENIRMVAVFAGENGIGPWQLKEIKAVLNVFEEKEKEIIPVILPHCCKEPDFPVFIRSKQRVDFCNIDPYPMAELIYGITKRRVKNIFIP